MRTVEQWLDAYEESHRNPVNKAIHWVCIPLIVISLIALLCEYQWSNEAQRFSDLNAGSLVLTGTCLYDLFLSWKLALGMMLVSLGCIGAVYGLEQIAQHQHISLTDLVWSIFIVAWIEQFIGHKTEGKNPSFFEDMQFFLIGPLWLLSFIYGRLGISYE